MNESLKYPLIFFHIPKNAGVSVRRILGLDTKYHPEVFKKTTNLAIDIQNRLGLMVKFGVLKDG
jgi:hypothetical protein